MKSERNRKWLYRKRFFHSEDGESLSTQNEAKLCAQSDGRLVRVLLLMGEALISCGAEILRAEDTLNRIGYAYGAREMNVLVITSNIIVTVQYADGTFETQTRRVRKSVRNDFVMLEDLNCLSRQICREPAELDEVESRIEKITQRPVSSKEWLAGCMIMASGFTVFFGGSLADGIASAAAGALIWWLLAYVAPICMNPVVFQFTASFVSGTAIGLMAQFIPAISRDPVMIGDIMLLIPGVTFTNALRDILLGDTISGSLRLIEALLLAGALVAGFIASLWILGRCFA